MADAAGDGAVTQPQLQARTTYRPGELLEAVPGLIVSQHSGEGKANQFYLRGFNLDHGTDLRTTVDGMPVNQRSHAHGQGWTDLNFVIPELASGLAYGKGPYDASMAMAARWWPIPSRPAAALCCTRWKRCTSPSASLVLGPWIGTEFYLNAGTGFHGNDARGTVLTVDPAGHGFRVRRRRAHHGGRPSRRHGAEASAYYQPWRWLSRDADLSYACAFATRPATAFRARWKAWRSLPPRSRRKGRGRAR